MTVRETLQFAAECRMPREATQADRIARVDEVIASLRLTPAQNTPVGDELIRGVSSGEKKVRLERHTSARSWCALYPLSSALTFLFILAYRSRY